MIASRALFAFFGFVILTAAGCGGDSTLPSDQQALGEEIKTLGGNYFLDKKAPEQGIFSVNLSGTKADDAIVAKLESLPNLTHLKLNATPVTNGVVATLRKMKNLKTLDVGNTKVTAESLVALQAALPECEIIGNVPETSPEPGAGGAPVN